MLIHRAAMYGELDTLKDVIEEKHVDPCITNNVSINTCDTMIHMYVRRLVVKQFTLQLLQGTFWF